MNALECAVGAAAGAPHSDGGTHESTEDEVKKSQQLAISVFQRALGTQRNQKGWSVVVSRGA